MFDDKNCLLIGFAVLNLLLAFAAGTSDGTDEITNNKKGSRNSSTIGIGLAVAVVCVVLILLVCFASRRVCKYTVECVRNNQRHEQDLEASAKPSTRSGATTSYATTNSYYACNTLSDALIGRPHASTYVVDPNEIPFGRFKEHVKQMRGDNAFEGEFLELTSEILGDQSQSIARQSGNAKKNLYPSILPYNQNIVPLTGGYINASYIKGEYSEKDYIATQGPNDETSDEFWQMVWEQEVTRIVMLSLPVGSSCEESAGSSGCVMYWPRSKELSLYKGGIVIRLANEKHYKQWVLREIRLSSREETRSVLHFQFLHWQPDTVPNWKDLETFMGAVRHGVNLQHQTKVVHCSTGSGRTGTFIALDRLMTQRHSKTGYNIKGLVSELRMLRPQMVQSLTQYEFIYQVAAILTDNPVYEEPRNSVWDLNSDQNYYWSFDPPNESGERDGNGDGDGHENQSEETTNHEN